MKIKISDLRRVISEASGGGFWAAVENIAYEGPSGVFLYQTEDQAKQHAAQWQKQNPDSVDPDDDSCDVYGPITFGENMLEYSKKLDSEDNVYSPSKKKF